MNSLSRDTTTIQCSQHSRRNLCEFKIYLSVSVGECVGIIIIIIKIQMKMNEPKTKLKTNINTINTKQ